LETVSEVPRAEDAGEIGSSSKEGEGDILHAQVDDDAFVDSCLDRILYTVDRNEGSDDSVRHATSHKLASGQVVFLSQAQPYCHRSPQFARYSLLQFE
jgi:hypothetical protein